RCGLTLKAREAERVTAHRQAKEERSGKFNPNKLHLEVEEGGGGLESRPTLSPIQRPARCEVGKFQSAVQLNGPHKGDYKPQRIPVGTWERRRCEGDRGRCLTESLSPSLTLSNSTIHSIESTEQHTCSVSLSLACTHAYPPDAVKDFCSSLAASRSIVAQRRRSGHPDVPGASVTAASQSEISISRRRRTKGWELHKLLFESSPRARRLRCLWLSLSRQLGSCLWANVTGLAGARGRLSFNQRSLRTTHLIGPWILRFTAAGVTQPNPG
ncbi:hypothetical protein KUCAC02_010155, partial [Chaenocephalus aceratus]